MSYIMIPGVSETSITTATHTLREAAREFADNVLSLATRAAYGKQWKAFVAWAASTGFPSLPAEPGTVALYLTARAQDGLRPSTLNQALCAIGWAHAASGYPSPARNDQVKALFLGIRRTVGSAPRKKAALLVPSLRAMMEQIGAGLGGRRDRALLLVGFAGAFRRSELVALQVEDALFEGEVVKILIRRSKTDQEGVGQTVILPMGKRLETCPVRSLRAWLLAASINSGPIFRAVTKGGHVDRVALEPGAVARIVKRYARAAGLDPKTFSGHSLRSGLVTQAAKAGKDQWTIMAQTRHKSVEVLRGYIQDADLTRDNAAKGIGL